MYLININNIWTAENDNSFLFTHRVLGCFFCHIPDMAVCANRSENMTTLMVLAYFYALWLLYSLSSLQLLDKNNGWMLRWSDYCVRHDDNVWCVYDIERKLTRGYDIFHHRMVTWTMKRNLCPSWPYI